MAAFSCASPMDPGARMRDIAVDVEITERAARRIVADLIESGYVADGDGTVKLLH